MSEGETVDEQTANGRVPEHSPVPSMRTRALIIIGLCGVAVTQPLLGLFGANPAFFVDGNYTTPRIVAFALMIGLAPAVAGIILAGGSALIDKRAGVLMFGTVVGVLAVAFAMALLRTLGVDSVLLVAPLVLAAGAGVVYVVWRVRAGQLFFSYLAVANLVFVAVFLFTSRASELVIGDSSDDEFGQVEMPPLEGPVVVVVLDEFGAATLTRGDGTLNSERYPGFAELAGVSTWFRNASSVENETQRAVPTILTGSEVERDSLPTYADHPRNLFTMLGPHAPLRRFEAVTNMCPPSVCAQVASRPLTQALKDASIVYGHRVLPAALRDELPTIDNSWGDFGGDGTEGVGGAVNASPWLMVERLEDITEAEKGAFGQATVMSHETAAIDGTPGVHYMHLLLPHDPWTLSRSGVSTTYDTMWSDVVDEEPGAPDRDFRARFYYQLHSMQAGAVDTLIGELVDHLRSLPTWKDTMLVVTADHGISFTPPDLGRAVVTDRNREEVYRVPMFIKLPGQTSGEIRDDDALTVDILPSMVDVLGVELDDSWQFDGHSLFDGSTPHTEPAVNNGVDGLLAIAERHAEDFPYGDDWMGLAAVGENGELVGRNVTELRVGTPSELEATLDDEEVLGSLPTDDGKMPFALTGTVNSRSADGEPPELVAAVNGTLAGVVGGYRREGSGWDFVGYVADLYREGANTVELYDVERRGRTVVLHPVG